MTIDWVPVHFRFFGNNWELTFCDLFTKQGHPLEKLLWATEQKQPGAANLDAIPKGRVRVQRKESETSI